MPNPLISTLVDNFDAGIDAETYDVGTWGDGTLITGAHTVVADSGRVAVVPPASGSGGGNGLITTGIYDATNQSVVMLMQPGLTAQGQNCMVNLGTGPNQFYGIWAIPGANSLIVRLRNGFNANVYSGTYSYSDKIWVKIQHRSSDNRWLFYVADFAAASDPPEDAEFTLLASRGADFGPGAVKLNFGVSGVVQQLKATQYFDGLNTATAGASGSTGTGSGTISLTGSSASTVTIAATASGSIGLTGASASNVAIAATGAGSVAITGAASGAAALSAASAGTFDLTGSIAGAVVVSASASGSLPVTGSASAALGTTVTATANGSLVLTGSANAAVAASAAATGEFALSGSAGASVAIIGAVSGSVALTGASSATTADNIATGTASGTLDFGGTADVAVLIRASANDNLALVGSAAGNTGKHRLYPLAGTAQPFPLTASQDFPLAGVTQTYPLGRVA